MKLENLLTLLNAGYTKEEINGILKEEHPEPEKEMQEALQEPKKEPAQEPKTEPKTEPEDPIQSLRAELKSLRDEIHKTNIARSEQPEKKTVDQILADAMKGGR